MTMPALMSRTRSYVSPTPKEEAAHLLVSYVERFTCGGHLVKEELAINEVSNR